MRMRLRIAALVVAGGLTFAGTAAPAAALNPVRTVCSAAGLLTRVINPCGVVKKAGGLVGVGKKLITGHPGAAAGAAAGAVGSSVVSIGLTAVAVWVLGGAKFALDETSKVLGATTSPQLRSTWFSGTYWRMAGISAVLTLPFLFAAAVQALLRTDLSSLARAAFMHLPLSMLVVSIAAPLTMLLLAASDELSGIVSGAAGNQSAHFLNAAALTVGGLSAAVSPFLAFLIGVFTVAGAVVLWIELLMRETAVYVIVLMLPLAFAAFVWPARRIWAVRTLELLGALILSKFAIVAVLSLGGAALGSTLGHPSVANWLAGLVLVLMAAFMPWALLRLVPLAEVAGSAAGPLRRELQREVTGSGNGPDFVARHAGDLLGRMRSQAEEAWPGDEAGSTRPRGDSVATSNAPAEDRSGEEEPAGRTAEEGVADEEAPDVAAPDWGVPDQDAPTTQAADDAAGPAPHAPGEPGTVGSAEGARDTEPAGRPDAAGSRATTPAPYDSEILDAEPLQRRMRLDPSDSRTYVVEPAPRRDDASPFPATGDDPDPLPPPQEDPERPA